MRVELSEEEKERMDKVISEWRDTNREGFVRKAVLYYLNAIERFTEDFKRV